jgi:hypothetical protein
MGMGASRRGCGQIVQRLVKVPPQAQHPNDRGGQSAVIEEFSALQISALTFIAILLLIWGLVIINSSKI